ncbi:MAG: hypothetical protein MJZ84_05220 [Paludibacteraceae bacterium]|nr:hypothetical protein [Paludibacteraceae bacterium]
MDKIPPIPDIFRRPQLRYNTPIEGEVVVYQLGNQIGIMLLESTSWFIAATNFDSDPNYIWHQDQVPEDIVFYYPEKEECDWGYDEFICYLFSPAFGNSKENPILSYLNRSSKYVVNYHSCKVLFGILQRVPFNVNNLKQYESLIWNALKHIGVDFDRYKAELYCYFLSIVRIWEYTKGNEKQYDYQAYLLNEHWEHLSWMYGMALGRVIGSEDKNFTSQINHLDSKKRSKYIHLYLPLVEFNIEKYPDYNNVEKKENLQKAIKKIKLTGEREKQEADLDELFQILFPLHFKRTMFENHPASSVAELQADYEEMQKKVAEKDKQQVTKVYIQSGAVYNDIHDNINPTIKS